MLFSSIIFIAYFLPVFLFFYYLSGMRIAVLLTGSVVFYVWGEGGYVFLLAALIVANYFAAHLIARGESSAKFWLIACLVLDLGVLGLFKYADFLVANVNQLSGAELVRPFGLELPLGISFFTFQLVSYIVDVYRREVEPERKPLAFATYILMFPHLIAGPIVRYANIREELERKGRHRKVGLGLQYFIVGLCQKVLIANSMAPLADQAFSMPGETLAAGSAWLGIGAYTLQIYFDFCGYSNMAIGLAFLLGFTFPKNFDYPYAARSVADFWRRWHMSLSFWFRDYVYIPLGGNRGSRLRTLFNLLFVFFLTGLWHGAAWNFIFWGLFHGAFLLLERVFLGEHLRRAGKVVPWLYTMLVVMVGWVFFRADSFNHALLYLQGMMGLGGLAPLPIEMSLLVTPEVLVALFFGILFSFPVLPKALDLLSRPCIDRSRQIVEQRLDTLHVHALPVGLLLLGFGLSCAMLASTTLNPFLYFRF